VILVHDSVLSLNPNTGKLKWYYQFSPHDTTIGMRIPPMFLIDTNIMVRIESYFCMRTEMASFMYSIARRPTSVESENNPADDLGEWNWS